MRAGERLKQVRIRLGITTREVEEFSRQIADAESNPEFLISNPWLTQIENRDSVPSVYKLFSLAAIYGLRYTDVLELYGVNLEKLGTHQLALPASETRPVSLDTYDKDRPVSFPVRFDEGFRLDRTSLLSRMVQVWGEVPVAILESLDIRKGNYGFIGLQDFTMFPLLRPGSFVQIDSRLNKVAPPPWRTELDRPIYFVELRDGYACSWCELRERLLTLVPHPLSGCGIRQFDFPTEAEVVGQVTAVAMRLAGPAQRSIREHPKSPERF